jgi:hypothetical protein
MEQVENHKSDKPTNDTTIVILGLTRFPKVYSDEMRFCPNLSIHHSIHHSHSEQVHFFPITVSGTFGVLPVIKAYHHWKLIHLGS